MAYHFKQLKHITAMSRNQYHRYKQNYTEYLYVIYEMLIGLATRYCDSSGQWSEVDVMECSSMVFLELQNQVSITITSVILHV